jgi:hypothetical protein
MSLRAGFRKRSSSLSATLGSTHLYGSIVRTFAMPRTRLRELI